MTTLEKPRLKLLWRPDKLIVAKSRSHTSNFADFDLCAPHVCCGWMDLHSDDGSGASADNQFFHLRALYWHPDAVLVGLNDQDQFYGIEPTNELVTLNGYKLHGLLPKAVAQEVIERNNEDGPLYQLFELMVNGAHAQYHPIMVWDWCDADGLVKK